MISDDSHGGYASSLPTNQENGLSSEASIAFLRAARAGVLEKVLDSLKHGVDINYQNSNGLNALHLASKEGHLVIVEELLARGSDVDVATKKGNTALHIAALAGKASVVRTLVDHGAKVNVQSQAGFTALYMAAQENHDDVVRYLLEKGADPSLTTEEGYTPLAVALQQGSEKAVAVLLEYGQGSKVKLPALHIAAKKDDVGAAALLLKSDSANKENSSGFTPLHIAAHYGRVNVAKLLIDKGADVNYKAKNAIAPLHVAAKWGQTGMVALLLERNAAINIQNKDGLTPLHCAARSGYPRVLDYMLEKGADHSAKTKNGLTPLHMATQGDHVDCARLLLHYQATIDDVTVDYLTALHVAAHYGHIKTAKLLLDRNCEPNARALNGFTPLHIACKKNRIKIVELLLKYGASIEATTESGLTPLHVAAFMGNMNIVLSLLQNGAAVDQQTLRGETPVHLAARANQTDVMRILLRNKANVNAKAREQQTPLHISARMGNVDSVLLLLQHGAAPEALTKDGYTPLHIAAKEGHEEVAAVLIDQGAAPDSATKKGMTPVHIAAKYGQKNVARLLLQRGAAPDAAGKNGLTPLHVAAHYSRADIGLLLLESRASPHCFAKNGYTPLHIAAKKNQMDMATSLLEYGARPDTESKTGFTPLHLASQEGHTDMASLLLEHKSNANCRAANGLTPMHLCAQEDRVSVAEILYKYGAEIDPRTKAGYTPLHTACHFGQLNMVRFLLQHQADVNATTRLGYAPLHQAAQQGHAHVVSLLLKHGASPDARTNTGLTPLHIARRLGYVSVEELLKGVTTDAAAPPPNAHAFSTEKYKMEVPEKMEETTYSDSEEEGDDDTNFPDHYSYLRSDNFVGLGDGGATPQVSQNPAVTAAFAEASDADARESKISDGDLYFEESFSEMQSPIGSPGPQVIRRGTRRTVQEMSTTVLRQAPSLADDEAMSMTSATPVLGKVFVLDSSAATQGFTAGIPVPIAVAASAEQPQPISELDDSRLQMLHRQSVSELDDGSSQLLPYSEDFREQKPVKSVRGVGSITPYSVDLREAEQFDSDDGGAAAAAAETAAEQEAKQFGSDDHGASAAAADSAAEQEAEQFGSDEHGTSVAAADSAAERGAGTLADSLVDEVEPSESLAAKQAPVFQSAVVTREADSDFPGMSDDEIREKRTLALKGGAKVDLFEHYVEGKDGRFYPPGSDELSSGAAQMETTVESAVPGYAENDISEAVAGAEPAEAMEVVAETPVDPSASVQLQTAVDVASPAVELAMEPAALSGSASEDFVSDTLQRYWVRDQDTAAGDVSPHWSRALSDDSVPVGEEAQLQRGVGQFIPPKGQDATMYDVYKGQLQATSAVGSLQLQPAVQPPVAPAVVAASELDGGLSPDVQPSSVVISYSLAPEGLVCGPDGQPVLGRDGQPVVLSQDPSDAYGSYSLAPDGTVLTPNQRPVLGADGNPVRVTPSGHKIILEPTGRLLALSDDSQAFGSGPAARKLLVVPPGSALLAPSKDGRIRVPAGSGAAASTSGSGDKFLLDKDGKHPVTIKTSGGQVLAVASPDGRAVCAADGKPVTAEHGSVLITPGLTCYVVSLPDGRPVLDRDGCPVCAPSGSCLRHAGPDGLVKGADGKDVLVVDPHTWAVVLDVNGQLAHVLPLGSDPANAAGNGDAATAGRPAAVRFPAGCELHPIRSDGYVQRIDRKVAGANGKPIRLPSGTDSALIAIDAEGSVVLGPDGRPVVVATGSRLVLPRPDGCVPTGNGALLLNKSGEVLRLNPEGTCFVVTPDCVLVTTKDGKFVRVVPGSQVVTPSKDGKLKGADGKKLVGPNGKSLKVDMPSGAAAVLGKDIAAVIVEPGNKLVKDKDGKPIRVHPNSRILPAGEDGRIVDKNGKPVQGPNGSSIQVLPERNLVIIGPSQKPVLDKSGSIVTVPSGCQLAVPGHTEYALGPDGRPVLNADGQPLALDPGCRLVATLADGTAHLADGSKLVGSDGKAAKASAGTMVVAGPDNVAVSDVTHRPPHLVTVPLGSVLVQPRHQVVMRPDGRPLFDGNSHRALGVPADVDRSSETLLVPADETCQVRLPGAAAPDLPMPIVFDSSGSRPVLVAPSWLLLVDAASGQPVLDARGQPITAPPGSSLATPGQLLYLVNPEDRRVVEDATAGGEPVWVATGTRLYAADEDGYVTLPAHHGGAKLLGADEFPLRVPTGQLVAVGPDGKFVAFTDRSPVFVPNGCIMLAPGYDFVRTITGQALEDSLRRPLAVEPGTVVVEAGTNGEVSLPDGRHAMRRRGVTDGSAGSEQAESAARVTPCSLVLVSPDGRLVCTQAGSPLTVPRGCRVTPVQQELVVDAHGQIVMDPDSVPSRPLEVAPGTKIVTSSADGHLYLPDGSKVTGLDGCPVMLEPTKQVLVLPDGKAVTDSTGRPIEVPAGSKVLPRQAGSGTLRKAKAGATVATAGSTPARASTVGTPAAAAAQSPATMGDDVEAVVAMQAAPGLCAALPSAALPSSDLPDNNQLTAGVLSPTSPPPLPTTLPPGSLPWSLFSQVNAMTPQEKTIEASYSGPTFGADLNPDNVAVDRSPVFTGKLHWKSFLVSFMVDARGGAMRGCRHAGMRLVIPPRCATCPTRITCRMVRRERLAVGTKVSLPPLGDGEALAARVVQLSPVGARFLKPVIIEIPHFAALRGREREVVILRSDDGQTWREHTLKATDDLVSETVDGSFDDVESTDELEQKRIVRILTPDFPQYFALMTRPRLESTQMGPAGGILNSTVVSQAQAVFPEGALKKQIRVGIQALPVPADVVARLLGNRVAVSAVVTVEPRRRRFHKPITLTFPVPKAAQRGMVNHYDGEARSTLRLLYSISEDANPAQWEDITGNTQLTFVSDCVSFTTTLSARFWLVDCQNTSEVVKMASALYKEIVSVPFMCKFVVFAKRHEQREARLRVFCMTDDKIDKTLEMQEHFSEIARSRDIEVLEGKPLYVEMAGSLLPVTRSSDQQLNVTFCAFKENRLPFVVRLRGDSGDYEFESARPPAAGRIAFMRHPKAGKGDAPQVPLCNLNLWLPDYIVTNNRDGEKQDIKNNTGTPAGATGSSRAFENDLPTIARTGLLGQPLSWDEAKVEQDADRELHSNSAVERTPHRDAVPSDVVHSFNDLQTLQSTSAEQSEEQFSQEADSVHEETIMPETVITPLLALDLHLPASSHSDFDVRRDVPEEEGVSTPPSSPAEYASEVPVDAVAVPVNAAGAPVDGAGMAVDAEPVPIDAEAPSGGSIEDWAAEEFDEPSFATTMIPQDKVDESIGATLDSTSPVEHQSGHEYEQTGDDDQSCVPAGDSRSSEALSDEQQDLQHICEPDLSTAWTANEVGGSKQSSQLGISHLQGDYESQQEGAEDQTEEEEEVCRSARHIDGNAGGWDFEASSPVFSMICEPPTSDELWVDGNRCHPEVASILPAGSEEAAMSAVAAAPMTDSLVCDEAGSSSLSASSYEDRNATTASSADAASSSSCPAGSSASDSLTEQLTSSAYSDVSSLSTTTAGAWPRCDELAGAMGEVGSGSGDEKHEHEVLAEPSHDAYAEQFAEAALLTSLTNRSEDDGSGLSSSTSLVLEEKCVSELRESEKHVRFPPDGDDRLVDVMHSNELLSESESSTAAVVPAVAQALCSSDVQSPGDDDDDVSLGTDGEHKFETMHAVDELELLPPCKECCYVGEEKDEDSTAEACGIATTHSAVDVANSNTIIHEYLPSRCEFDTAEPLYSPVATAIADQTVDTTGTVHDSSSYLEVAAEEIDRDLAVARQPLTFTLSSEAQMSSPPCLAALQSFDASSATVTPMSSEDLTIATALMSAAGDECGSTKHLSYSEDAAAHDTVPQDDSSFRQEAATVASYTNAGRTGGSDAADGVFTSDDESYHCGSADAEVCTSSRADISRHLHTIDEMPILSGRPPFMSATGVASGSAYITVDHGLNEIATEECTTSDNREAASGNADHSASPAALCYERSQSVSEATSPSYDDLLSTGTVDELSVPAVRNTQRTSRRHHSLPDCAGSRSEAACQELVQHLMSLPEADVSNDAQGENVDVLFATTAFSASISCDAQWLEQQEHAGLVAGPNDDSSARPSSPVVETVLAPVHCDQVEGACFGKLRHHETGNRGSPTYVSYDDLSRPTSVVLRPASDDEQCVGPKLWLPECHSDDWSKVGVFGSLDGLDLQLPELSGMSGGDSGLGGTDGSPSLCQHNPMSDSGTTHTVDGGGMQDSTEGSATSQSLSTAAESEAVAASAVTAAMGAVTAELDVAESVGMTAAGSRASLVHLEWESKLVSEMEQCLAASELINVRSTEGADEASFQSVPFVSDHDATSPQADDRNERAVFDDKDDLGQVSIGDDKGPGEDVKVPFASGDTVNVHWPSSAALLPANQQDSLASAGDNQSDCQHDEDLYDEHVIDSELLVAVSLDDSGEQHYLELAEEREMQPCSDGNRPAALEAPDAGERAGASSWNDDEPFASDRGSILSAGVVDNAISCGEQLLTGPPSGSNVEGEFQHSLIFDAGELARELPDGSDAPEAIGGNDCPAVACDHGVTILVMDADGKADSIARDFGCTVEYDDEGGDGDDDKAIRGDASVTLEAPAHDADGDAADSRVTPVPPGCSRPAHDADELPGSCASTQSPATDASFSAATYVLQTGEILLAESSSGTVPASGTVGQPSADPREASSASVDACGTMSSSMSDDVFYEDLKWRSRSVVEGDGAAAAAPAAESRSASFAARKEAGSDACGVGGSVSASLEQRSGDVTLPSPTEWDDRERVTPVEPQQQPQCEPWPAFSGREAAAVAAPASITASSAALAVAPYLTELFECTDYGGVHTPESFGLSITPEDYPSSDVSPSRDTCFVGAVSEECRRRSSGDADADELDAQGTVSEDGEQQPSPWSSEDDETEENACKHDLSTDEVGTGPSCSDNQAEIQRSASLEIASSEDHYGSSEATNLTEYCTEHTSEHEPVIRDVTFEGDADRAAAKGSVRSAADALIAGSRSEPSIAEAAINCESPLFEEIDTGDVMSDRGDAQIELEPTLAGDDAGQLSLYDELSAAAAHDEWSADATEIGQPEPSSASGHLGSGEVDAGDQRLQQDHSLRNNDSAEAGDSDGADRTDAADDEYLDWLKVSKSDVSDAPATPSAQAFPIVEEAAAEGSQSPSSHCALVSEPASAIAPSATSSFVLTDSLVCSPRCHTEAESEIDSEQPPYGWSQSPEGDDNDGMIIYDRPDDDDDQEEAAIMDMVNAYGIYHERQLSAVEEVSESECSSDRPEEDDGCLTESSGFRPTAVSQDIAAHAHYVDTVIQELTELAACEDAVCSAVADCPATPTGNTNEAPSGSETSCSGYEIVGAGEVDGDSQSLDDDLEMSSVDSCATVVMPSAPDVDALPDDDDCLTDFASSMSSSVQSNTVGDDPARSTVTGPFAAVESETAPFSPSYQKDELDFASTPTAEPPMPVCGTAAGLGAAARTKDADTISMSSLYEFETLEREAECREPSASPSTPRRHMSPPSERRLGEMPHSGATSEIVSAGPSSPSRYRRTAASGARRGGSSTTTDEAGNRSSLCSLEEFEIVEKDIATCDEVEREAMKVVASLESGELLLECEDDGCSASSPRLPPVKQSQSTIPSRPADGMAFEIRSGRLVLFNVSGISAESTADADSTVPSFGDGPPPSKTGDAGHPFETDEQTHETGSSNLAVNASQHQGSDDIEAIILEASQNVEAFLPELTAIDNEACPEETKNADDLIQWSTDSVDTQVQHMSPNEEQRASIDAEAAQSHFESTCFGSLASGSCTSVDAPNQPASLICEGLSDADVGHCVATSRHPRELDIATIIGEQILADDILTAPYSSVAVSDRVEGVWRQCSLESQQTFLKLTTVTSTESSRECTSSHDLTMESRHFESNHFSEEFRVVSTDTTASALLYEKHGNDSSEPSPNPGDHIFSDDHFSHVLLQDQMSTSFHQAYPQALNPFSDSFCPASSPEEDLPAADMASHDTVVERSHVPAVHPSRFTTAAYVSDYRYEPKQKVFTMAEIEAERNSKRFAASTSSDGTLQDVSQSPTTNVCPPGDLIPSDGPANTQAIDRSEEDAAQEQELL